MAQQEYCNFCNRIIIRKKFTPEKKTYSKCPHCGGDTTTNEYQNEDWKNKINVFYLIANVKKKKGENEIIFTRYPCIATGGEIECEIINKKDIDNYLVTTKS